MNFRLLLLNILLLSTFIFAQNRKVYVDSLFSWDGSGTAISDYNYGIQTKDIANSSITSAKIATATVTVADTTELKALTENRNGFSVYLQSLSSTNPYGGGVFVLIDSTYSESTTVYGSTYRVVAYPATTSGKQWVRESYHNNNEVNIEWAGAQPDTTVDSRNFIQAAINYQFDEGGGVVYMPGGADGDERYGQYKVSKGVGIGSYAIELKQLVTFTGKNAPQSNQASTIMLAGGQDSCWVFGTTSAVYHDTSGLTGGSKWAHGVQLKDIRINCNGTYQSTFAGGVNYDQPGEVSRMQNIAIVGIKATGGDGQAGMRTDNGAPGFLDGISVFGDGCAYEFKSGTTFATMISTDDTEPAIRHISGNVSIGMVKLEYDDLTDDTTSVIMTKGPFNSVLKIGATYINAGSVNKGCAVKIQKTNASDVPTVDIQVHNSGLSYTYINKSTTDTLTEAQAGQSFNGIRTGKAASFWYMDVNNKYANTRKIQYKDDQGTTKDFANFANNGYIYGNSRSAWEWRIEGSPILQVFSNRVDASKELKAKAGLRVGGDPYTKLDSTTVVADTLLLWSGSTAYKAVKK